MKYLPLFVRGDDFRCLVVGGGDIAFRKISILVRANVQCTVVSNSINSEIVELASSHNIELNKRKFEIDDVDGFDLVIAATNDAFTNQVVHDAGKKKGILVNVVDDASLSSVIFPSIIDRDPVTIGITTSGTSPSLARRIRSKIEATLPRSLGNLAEFLATKRKTLRSNDSENRITRVEWDAILDSNVPEFIHRGNYQTAEEEFEQVLENSANKKGLVSLVGAGPGDPDLLTLKALDCMQRADVVYYDNLVPQEILDRVRREAKRVYVGKRRNFAAVRQEAINEMMLSEAQNGKRVVRLKGGDPFLFGRGGEETESLRTHQIPFEVVPGITAALGCAAYAGIPLTHRDYSQSVRFVTGQLSGGTVNLDWPELAKPNQTLVIYMGLTGLKTCMQSLIDAGIDSKTPVAVISRGTLSDQRTVIGDVESIAKEVESEKIPGPTTTIVGNVVHLAHLH